MQLARNVVDTLVVTQYPLRDRLTNLPDKTFHIEILEDAPDDGICEQIRGGQWQHQARCNIGHRLIEVCCVLHDYQRE